MSSKARPYIGGQALIEGVMMRSPHSFAMVCRKRSGELVVRERPIVDERKGVRAIPFVRGVATLVESLRLGTEALRFSSDLFEADLEEEEAKEKAKAAADRIKRSMGNLLAALSLPIVALVTRADDDAPPPAVAKKKDDGNALGLVSMAIAMLVFIAAPQAAANLVNKVFHLGYELRAWQFQLITGAMKLAVVVGYMMLLRQAEITRRVFQFHGAEHKTISTYEAEEELVVANARKKTTLHPRCGTTFLVMVAMVSVIVFSAIGPMLPKIGALNGLWENVAFFFLKLPFIPVIAGITFEIQRVFARFCTTGPLRVLLWPGFLVQKITTIEPDDQQLEVALASLRATLWREESREAAPAGVTDKRFDSYDDFRSDPGYAAG